MKKHKRKEKGLFNPSENSFACQSDHDYSQGDYLDFASNGMTDNEKIDGSAYYENFLGYDTDDDRLR